MCDVDSEAVQEIAQTIVAATSDRRQRAVLAFEHAQNAVLYRYANGTHTHAHKEIQAQAQAQA